MNRTDRFRASRSRTQLTLDAAGRLMTALLEDEDHDSRAAGAPQITGYVIDRVLGRGAGGSVHLAYWGDHDEPVAVKVLSKPLGTKKSDARAWRELDILSQLKIPGVPQVLDYGVSDGRMYITTKFVQGKTLSQHCEQANLSLEDRVRLLVNISELVQRVHEHGIIHRDLKPANIMIQPDGRPMLLDFGVAYLMDDQNEESLTAAGDPIGTVGYMAPEQARGERDSVSSRCDIYAIGAVACQLLTGRTPHDVHVPIHEAVRRVAQEPARTPIELNPQCPKPLSGIVAKALESKPEDRYSSAAALADDMLRWLRHEPIPWQKNHWFSRQLLTIRRNPAVFFARAAIWALVLATVFASSIAFANYKVAQGERINAQEASKLRQQAEVLADEQSALAKKQTELAQHWEAEAREREEWRKEVEAAELNRVAMREKQLTRIKKATEGGELYGASLVLLNFAEEIRELRPDDKAMLDAFVERLNALIEAAGKAPPPQP